MKLILLSLGALINSAMGSSEFLEVNCSGKNQPNLEISIHHNIKGESATYSVRNTQSEMTLASGEFPEIRQGKTDLGFYAVSYLASSDPNNFEGIAVGFQGVEKLEDLEQGNIEGNGEGLLSLADDNTDYVTTDSCKIKKTQTHCLEVEDAIHLRFCEEILPTVQEKTCEDAAKKAVANYLEYYSQIRNHQGASFEIRSVVSRSISYPQLQNEGFIEVGYGNIDPNGFEIRYATRFASVLVKRTLEENCKVVDILID